MKISKTKITTSSSTVVVDDDGLYKDDDDDDVHDDAIKGVCTAIIRHGSSSVSLFIPPLPFTLNSVWLSAYEKRDFPQNDDDDDADIAADGILFKRHHYSLSFSPHFLLCFHFFTTQEKRLLTSLVNKILGSYSTRKKLQWASFF